ncbi:MAG: hypothetical protein AAGJ08_05900 [Cyanobacteria bacterium P01_H01_bin.35]
MVVRIGALINKMLKRSPPRNLFGTSKTIIPNLNLQIFQINYIKLMPELI